MGALIVIVGCPSRDHDTGMGQIAEHGFIQQLVSHAAIDAFEKAVLHRLSRRDAAPCDLVLGTPAQDRVAGQLRPIAYLEDNTDQVMATCVALKSRSRWP